MISVLRQRRSVFSVPGEIAREQCWPRRLAEVRDPYLKQIAMQVCKEWLSARTKEGDELVERDDVHVYGPFPDSIRLEAYITHAHMGVDAREREALIVDRDPDPRAFAHYLLNANFIQKVVADRVPVGAQGE